MIQSSQEDDNETCPDFSYAHTHVLSGVKVRKTNRLAVVLTCQIHHREHYCPVIGKRVGSLFVMFIANSSRLEIDGIIQLIVIRDISSFDRLHRRSCNLQSTIYQMAPLGGTQKIGVAVTLVIELLSTRG